MTVRYSFRFDATYDDVKDIWLEGQCSDAGCGCEFCEGRPDRPSQMKPEDKEEANAL